MEPNSNHELTQLEIQALNLLIAIQDSLDKVPSGIIVSDGDEDYDLKELLECFVENTRNS